MVDDNGALRVWLNKGKIPGPNIEWNDIGKLADGAEEGPNRVQFGDVDGDGLADYIVYYRNKTAFWWRNNGNLGKNSAKKNFDARKLLFDKWEDDSGYVIIQDIDGDGKADYLYLEPDGALRAWKNLGDDGFESLGIIAPGLNGIPGSKVHIRDYDGIAQTPLRRSRSLILP